MLNFHNSKEEIVKGYDVVPQLNDNVRLTIEEYRNKLYKFIQDSKSQDPSTQNQRPNTHIKTTKQQQAPSNTAQHQQQQASKSAPVRDGKSWFNHDLINNLID